MPRPLPPARQRQLPPPPAPAPCPPASVPSARRPARLPPARQRQFPRPDSVSSSARSPQPGRLSQMLRQPFEVLFGVDRRHAARPCGGDRLAVKVVLHVTAGED